MSSGLDWTSDGPLSKADPYLAWADATAYASYRLPSVPGEDSWWLVLIELAAGTGDQSPLQRLLDSSSKDWLQVPEVFVDLDAKGKGFLYCTARVKPPFFKSVLAGGSLADIVLRYKLCSPVEYPVEALRSVEGASTVPSAGADGGPVMALIDGGLALGHAAFLKPDHSPRVSHFWRQDDYLGSRYLGDRARTRLPWPNPDGHWNPSKTMGYGAELDRHAISAAMAASHYLGLLDEDALYQRLGLWDLDRLAHHGTHVLSLGAGPYRYPEQMGKEDSPPDWGAPLNGDLRSAEGCDLVGVQLAWANVLDTSGRSGDAHILDALMYVWSRCADQAEVAVNLSWGVNAGPHDGSSILEKAMIDWCGLRTGRSSIVVPAGNSYQARGHANDKLEKGEAIELNWRILPDCHTPSFLELWVDRDISDTQQLVVQLTPPGAPAPFEIRVPGVQTWSDATPPAFPQATVVMLNRPNLGASGSMVLVAVEPTVAEGPEMPAPAGVWQVRLTNAMSTTITVCAYIERNDVAMGLFTGARQSYFEDERYNLSEGIDDEKVQKARSPLAQGNQSVVRRTGTFNHLSTGADKSAVHSVGGLVMFPTDRPPGDLAPSPYSSRWDDANDTRVTVRRKHPTTMMPSDDSLVLPGLRAAASRSGAVVRLVGTSSAVPLAVRSLVSRKGLPKPPVPAPAPATGGNTM